MPTVILSGGGHTVRAEAPEGGALVDLCDASTAPIPLSCRGATCGTCRVTVVAGAKLLAPPNADEAALLASLGANAAERLACQARVLPGRGRVELRAKTH